MVGQLYPQGDSRRDSAYTIFYMGINLGAFVAPLACGALGENPRFGWHYGFALAGVGMVLGLLNFAFFQKTLGHAGFAPGRGGVGERRITLADWLHVGLLSAVGAGLVALALAPSAAIQGAIPGAAKLVMLGYFVLLACAFGLIIAGTSRAFGLYRPDASPIDEARVGDVADVVEPGRGLPEAPGANRLPDNSTRSPAHPVADARASGEVATEEEEEDPKAAFTWVQWQRIAVILILSAFSIVFWTGFEQSGGTLNLFADNQTERFGLRL